MGVQSNPVFIASDANSGGNRQPILGGLEAAPGPMGGVMLFFGTGQNIMFPLSELGLAKILTGDLIIFLSRRSHP